MHYNTTEETGESLKEYREKAERQEDKVLAIFREMGFPMTAEQVHNQFPNSFMTPITSIRRAITDLTNKGLLERTEEKRKSFFNRATYVWKLK